MITRKLLYNSGTLILFLLLHSGTALLAQNNGSGQIKISGIIRNKLNEVMKGATVENLNTHQSVLSGANGQYIIAASKGDSLVASFVGYTPFRWAFTDRIDYDITLETVAGSLNEVVVVGYGRQRKISQIGSQAILNTQDLKQPIANVGAGLAGRLAGLV